MDIFMIFMGGFGVGGLATFAMIHFSVKGKS